MNPRLLLCLAAFSFAFGCANVEAQIASDPNEGSRLTRDAATGAYNLSWWGRSGRTYFLQQSENLANWTYLPMIESGANQIIRWGMASSAQRSFLRLRYSDLPTANPFESDFDNDGVHNYDELLIGTDPLSWHDGDSTHAPNGLPDDWELYRFGVVGVDPAADPDGDGRTNLQEYQLGSDPNDSSNGRVAQLAKVSGDLQDGYVSQGSTLVPATLAPVKVRVTDASTGGAYPGVAVSFAPTADAQVSASSDPGANWQDAVNVSTDAGGFASVWVKMPATVPKIDQIITASVPGTEIAQFVVKTPNGTDSDRNGLADAWEMTNFNSLGHDAAGDDDQDGLSNAEEMAGGTNPNNSDTDGDRVADGKDALPLDPDFTFPYKPVSRYAVMNLGAFKPVALNNKGQAVGYDASGNPAVWSKGQIHPMPPLDPALLDYHYYDYVLTAGPGAVLVGISDDGVIAANQDFYTPDSLRYVLHTSFTVRFDAATGAFSSPIPLKGLYTNTNSTTGTPDDPTRVYVSGMSPNGNLIGTSDFYSHNRTFYPLGRPPEKEYTTTEVYCAWLPPAYTPQQIPNFPDANDQPTLTFPDEPGYIYYNPQGLYSDHTSYASSSITNSGKVLTMMNESTNPATKTLDVRHALLGDSPTAVPIELGIDARPASFSEHLQLAVGTPYDPGTNPIPATIWFKKDGAWSMKTLPGVPSNQQSPYLSFNPTKINDLGQMLLQYNRSPSWQALWQNGKLQDLSVLADSTGGYFVYSAADLNNLGMMVGSASYRGVDAQGNPQGDWEDRGVMLIPAELSDLKKIGDQNDDVVIEAIPPKTSGQSENAYIQRPLSNKQIAYIEPHGAANNTDPEMPHLAAKLPSGSPSLKIRWKLLVEYKRGNGYRASYVQDFTRPEDTVKFPASREYTEEMDADQEWRIFETSDWTNQLADKGFFGGTAKLYLWIPSQGAAPTEPFMTFLIGGKNPDPAKAKTFINSAAGNQFWYAYAIAKHETYGRVRDNGVTRFYNQFYTDYQGGPIGDSAVDMGWAAWAKGWPIYNLDRDRDKNGKRYQNGPGGYGMYQLTLGPKAPGVTVPTGKEDYIARKAIWNWQDNARGAITELQGKTGAAKSLHDGLIATYPNAGAIPNYKHFSALEAILVTYYNGMAGGQITTVSVNGYKTDPRTCWRPHSGGWTFLHNRYVNVEAKTGYVHAVDKQIE